MILLSAVSRYEKSKQTIIIALFFFAQSPLPERLEQAIQATPPPPPPPRGKIVGSSQRKKERARQRETLESTDPLPLPLTHAKKVFIIQDSLGFWVPCCVFYGLDSGIPVSGSWTPGSNRYQDSGYLVLNYEFQSPGFWIPQAKISRISEFALILRGAKLQSGS